MCLAMTTKPNPHQTPEGRQRALDILFRNFKQTRPELYQEAQVNGEVVEYINMEVPTETTPKAENEASKVDE